MALSDSTRIREVEAVVEYWRFYQYYAWCSEGGRVAWKAVFIMVACLSSCRRRAFLAQGVAE